MIKDRNIDPKAAIQLHKIMGGMSGRAETFYAIKSGTDYATWIADRVDNDHWSSTIQDVIDNKCVDGRPDHVYIGPGKIKENVLIVDREGLSLSGIVEGWFTQIRPSDATTKRTLSSVSGFTVQGLGFAILDRSVSISDLLIDGGGNYLGIYIGDGYRIDTGYSANSASARIRNVVFRGGNEGELGILLDGCSDNVVIEGCTFDQLSKAGIQIDPGGARTVQRPIIRDNLFRSCNIYGIDMYSSATTVNVLVQDNTFQDGAQAFTYGVRFQSTGVHSLVGNRFACANTWSASATDFISGNYGSNGADGSEVVSEA